MFSIIIEQKKKLKRGEKMEEFNVLINKAKLEKRIEEMAKQIQKAK